MSKRQFFKRILCLVGLLAGLTTAKPLTGCAATLPAADLSKGVTIETEDGSKYLYLNGNSVVIKEAQASTEQNPLFNMYIDANRNGIVDAGEEIASVDGIQDFEPCMIYGIKAEKSDIPVRITVESGLVSSIYAVYNGVIASDVADEAAVSIYVNGGQVGSIGGVVSSNISSASDTAVRYEQTGGNVMGEALIASKNSTLTAKGGTDGVVDVNVSAGSTNNLAILDRASVMGNEKSQALDISLTGASQISQLYISRSSYSEEDEKYTISGNVSISLDYDEKSDSNNVYTLYGLMQTNTDIEGNVSYTVYNGRIAIVNNLLTSVSLTGAFDINITETEISGLNYPVVDSVIDGDVTLGMKENTHVNGYLRYLEKTVVNGNVKIEFDELSYSNGVTVAYESTVSGDVTARINGSSSYGTIYGVDGKHSDKDYSVDGNVNLEIIGGVYSSVQVINRGNVNGNVVIDISDLECSSSFYGSYSSQIKGDLVINIPDSANAKFYSASGAMNSDIGGNYKFNFHNDSENYMNVYGLDATSVAKDVDINIGAGKYANVYGIASKQSVVAGNVKVAVKDAEISSYIFGINGARVAGNCDVKITDCLEGGSYSSAYYYGINNAEIDGMAVVDMSGNTAYNLFGIYGTNVNNQTGNAGESAACSVTLKNNIAKNQLNALQSGTVNGDAVIDSIGNICQYYYGFYSGTLNGTITLNSSYENDASITDGEGNSIINSYPNAGKGDFRGCYSGTVTGAVNITAESNHFKNLYLMDSLNCGNGGNITVSNGSYGSAGDTIMVYPCFANSANKGDSVKKFTIAFNGVDFSSCDKVSIIGTLVEGYSAEITLDDNCSLPADYTVIPNRNSVGYAVLTCNGDCYIAGSGTIAEDITARNVYLGNYKDNTGAPGYFIVPEGVTITGSEKVYIPVCAQIVLEGKIAGDTANPDASAGHNGRFCMNGGSVEGTITGVDCYYPVEFVYNEKRGTIIPDSSTSGIIKAQDNNYYGCSGQTVSVGISVNTGYKLTSATWQTAGETPSDMAAEGEKYSFDMPASPVTVEAEITGKQITIGKTTADPVAKLGEVYTAEEPLYSMSDLAIANDARAGSVTYELAEGNSLPEGLVLKDGILSGTPSKAYESGKQVVFKVTGRNETTANVTLNIIVTAGSAEQTGQDGRISVDEEGKEINLLGSSVVIDTYVDGENTVTGIYLDDNRDGTADRTVPLYYGDLSEFTVYGVKDADIKKPVQITVKNGNIKSVYGAYGSEITISGKDAVIMDYQGGYIESTTPLQTSNTSGFVRLEYVSGAVKTVNGLADSEYAGYYRNAAGAVSISGDYTAAKEIDAASLTISSLSAVPQVTFEKPVTISGKYSMNNAAVVTFKDTLHVGGDFSTYRNSTHTFKKPVTVEGNMTFSSNDQAAVEDKLTITSKLSVSSSANVVLEGETSCASLSLSSYAVLDITKSAIVNTGTTTISSFARVYHRGIYAGTGAVTNSSGYWCMMGGTFAEGTDADSIPKKYYPVSFNTELDKAAVTPYNGAVTVEDVSYMSPDVTSNSIKYTVIPGYDSYISINGGQTQLMEASPYTFTMTSEPAEIVVDYVPKNISVTKRYADPVIVAGTEYTDENPVYNLKTLSISDDTTSRYGGDVRYALKSGSSLPEGLQLVDGKITGTPVAANGDGSTVKFVVTGRNGTTANVELKIVIKGAGYTQQDINDVAEVSGTIIRLNGASVVIIPDVEDTSKSAIYMDADHDGVADNNHALKINGQSGYSLSSYKIYGYDNTEEPFDGDISIYVLGGKIGTLYGAYGKSGAYVTVKGSVDLYLKEGSYSTVSALYYGKADSAGFFATGGSFSGCMALKESEVNDYNFEFSGTATTSGSLYASYNSAIVNDVNAKVGVISSSYGFTGTSGHFYGVHGGSSAYDRKGVGGDINYTIDGRWYTKNRGMNFLAYNTDIEGDLNINWKDGSFGSVYADNSNEINGGFIRESTVHNINVEIAENAEIDTGILNAAIGGTVNNIRCIVPKSDNIRIDTFNAVHKNYMSTVNGSAYVDNQGYVQIYGTYTITEDVDAKKIVIAEGADVTVAEGVTVSTSAGAEIAGTVNNYGIWNSNYDTINYDTIISGRINNYGKWNVDSETTLSGTIDNSGVLRNGTKKDALFTIDTDAVIINEEQGSYSMGYISNGGKIVNYGKLVQTYNTISIGNIYTTTIPSMYRELSRYSTIYYNTYIDDDYPAYCVDSVELKVTDTSAMAENVIEGDTNTYVKAGSVFYVELGTLLEGIVVEKVTYGSDNQTAGTTNQTRYQGTVGYEPTVIKLSFSNSNADIEGITLDKTEDEVTGLQVGKTTTASNPAYDLTRLVVSNDDESIANAYVTYQLGVDSSLPAGMILRNGKIYGTPTEAADTANVVNIIVKGRNQTYASFALTFTSVAKGVPDFKQPGTLKADAGDTLADVELPVSTTGAYVWPDDTLPVGDASEEGNEFDIQFIPKDTVNYDWSLIDAAVGTYANGVVTTKVRIKIRKLTPEYTVPEGVTAVYGDTLADVIIPETETGSFVWADGTQQVGEIGEHVFKAVYVPKDTANYDSVENIRITVTVTPKLVESYTPKLKTVNGKEGQTLSEIQLPDVEGGKYQWITQATTVIKEGASYKIGYKPDDVTNYDWTAVSGWSNAYKAVIFNVTVQAEHTHQFDKAWKSDTVNHWHVCACGEKNQVAKHTWDAGKVTKQPSETAEGVKTFTCTVCKKTKTEKIPATGVTVVDITKSEAKLTVSGIVDMDYTGKAIEQSGLVVKFGTKTLALGKDYTLAYSDNVKVGTATISITGKGSYKGTIQKTFKITLTKGKTYVVNNMKYKITKADASGKGTVSITGTTYKKSDKKLKKITIGATVNIGGIPYKVTEIGSNAFKNYKYVTAVTIGSNVKKIGKNAFYGCKKLKTITIKTTKLTKKTVGSKAFKGTYKKPTVKVPKKKLKSYKTILKSKGMSKNARYKKG